MDVAYKLRIEGRVTGVGFRYSAMAHARMLGGLRGYVRNAGEDEVEDWVEGDERQVELMLEWLRHGPAHARVDRISANPVPLACGYESFIIT